MNIEDDELKARLNNFNQIASSASNYSYIGILINYFIDKHASISSISNISTIIKIILISLIKYIDLANSNPDIADKLKSLNDICTELFKADQELIVVYGNIDSFVELQIHVISKYLESIIITCSDELDDLISKTTNKMENINKLLLETFKKPVTSLPPLPPPSGSPLSTIPQPPGDTKTGIAGLRILSILSTQILPLMGITSALSPENAIKVVQRGGISLKALQRGTDNANTIHNIGGSRTLSIKSLTLAEKLTKYRAAASAKVTTGGATGGVTGGVTEGSAVGPAVGPAKDIAEGALDEAGTASVLNNPEFVYNALNVALATIKIFLSHTIIMKLITLQPHIMLKVLESTHNLEIHDRYIFQLLINILFYDITYIQELDTFWGDDATFKTTTVFGDSITKFSNLKNNVNILLDEPHRLKGIYYVSLPVFIDYVKHNILFSNTANGYDVFKKHVFEKITTKQLYQNIIIDFGNKVIEILNNIVTLIPYLNTLEQTMNNSNTDFQKNLNQNIQENSNNTLLTYIKIRGDAKDYNKRFNIFLKRDTYNSMIIQYNTDDIPYYTYDPQSDSFTLTTDIENDTNFTIIMDANHTKTIHKVKKYDNTYAFGNFTKIFPPHFTNQQIAEDTSIKDNIITKLTAGSPVLILGYGASGAGKTSSLIYFKGVTDGYGGYKIKPENGIVVSICNQMAARGYTKINITIKEFFYNYNLEYNKTGNPSKIPYEITTPTPTSSKTDGISFTYNDSVNEYQLNAEYSYEAHHIYRSSLFKDHTGITYNENESKVTLHHGTPFGKIIAFLIDVDRYVKATLNNVNSSRSHVLLFITLNKSDLSESATLIIADFAGVENKFTCDKQQLRQFATLERENSDKKYYYNTEIENPGVYKGGASTASEMPISSKQYDFFDFEKPIFFRTINGVEQRTNLKQHTYFDRDKYQDMKLEYIEGGQLKKYTDDHKLSYYIKLGRIHISQEKVNISDSARKQLKDTIKQLIIKAHNGADTTDTIEPTLTDWLRHDCNFLDLWVNLIYSTTLNNAIDTFRKNNREWGQRDKTSGETNKIMIMTEFSEFNSQINNVIGDKLFIQLIRYIIKEFQLSISEEQLSISEEQLSIDVDNLLTPLKKNSVDGYKFERWLNQQRTGPPTQLLDFFRDFKSRETNPDKVGETLRKIIGELHIIDNIRNFFLNYEQVYTMIRKYFDDSINSYIRVNNPLHTQSEHEPLFTSLINMFCERIFFVMYIKLWSIKSFKSVGYFIKSRKLPYIDRGRTHEISINPPLTSSDFDVNIVNIFNKLVSYNKNLNGQDSKTLNDGKDTYQTLVTMYTTYKNKSDSYESTKATIETKINTDNQIIENSTPTLTNLCKLSEAAKTQISSHTQQQTQSTYSYIKPIFEKALTISNEDTQRLRILPEIIQLHYMLYALYSLSPYIFKNIEEWATIITTIEEKDAAKQQFIQTVCDNRTKEGTYINSSLKQIRDAISEVIYYRNLDNIDIIPNYIDKCLIQYCPIRGYQCLKSKKVVQMKAGTSIFDSIFTFLQKYNNQKYSTKEKLYKQLILAVFLVLNIEKGANNPPPVPYIDINEFKKFLLEQDLITNVSLDDQFCDVSTGCDAIKKHVDNIITNIQNYNDKTSELWSSLNNEIPRMMTDNTVYFSEEKTKRILKNDIDKFILIIDNHNSLSSLGTVEYVDKIAKYSTINSVCMESDFTETSMGADYIMLGNILAETKTHKKYLKYKHKYLLQQKH